MELDQATQTYIARFRIKELHQVLKRLGLPNQGLKSALVQRLVTYIKRPGGRAAGVDEAHRVRDIAKEVVRQVYVQAFLPPGADTSPAATAAMNATQQHHNGRQNASLEELYPHEPPGFVTGRKKPPTAHHLQSSKGNNGHASHNLAAQRGGKHNPNVKCPCGKESYADTKELLVCHTCKMLNRQTLQHVNHMGYDMSKFTAAQRAGHMCEQCRLDHADPFWRQFPESRPGTDPRIHWIVPLTWLKRQGPISQNSPPQNSSLFISTDVPLPKAIIEERRRNKDLQIQAVCLSVSDSNICQNRLHWPDHMEISVRSHQARVMSRNHKLGANGRDAPTDLTPWLHRDATSVQVSVKALGPENSFLFGVRAVVPQTPEVVISMLAPPESPDEAVKRIAHTVGGGQDDDDDDIIMGDTLPVNLRDPLSNLRVQRGVRVVNGKNLQPFDLDFFMDSAKRSRKWQCPVSMKNVLVHQLQPDMYMNAVLHALRHRSNVTEIQVNKDGMWRAEDGEVWQDIRKGPLDSFKLPPKREEAAAASAADGGGASSASGPSRGQKRPREEEPKVPVAALNGHQQGGAVQPGRAGPAVAQRQSGNAATLAVQKPPENTGEVITISDSDDDDEGAAPAAAPAPAAVQAAVAAPVAAVASHAPRMLVPGRGMMLSALAANAATMPPVHLQHHIPSASAHTSHPAIGANMLLPPVAQLPMPAISHAQPQPAGYGGYQHQAQTTYVRSTAVPPPCENTHNWRS